MEKHDLFLNILQDLKEKIDSNNPYQIIKSSELIRSLLFDASGPLVNKVNKEFKVKIEYEYLDTKSGYRAFLFKMNPESFIVGDGLYPEWLITRGDIVKTKIDSFFKTMLIVKDGKEMTVKDVLDYVINCLGGTHHEEPKKDERVTLENMKNMFFGNTNAVVHQVKSIGTVVLKAMEPVKSEIIKKYYS